MKTYKEIRYRGHTIIKASGVFYVCGQTKKTIKGAKKAIDNQFTTFK